MMMEFETFKSRNELVAYPPIGAHFLDQFFDAFKCYIFDDLPIYLDIIKVWIWF